MITLVIIRDCHASHNEVVEARTEREERRVRLRAASKGYLVAVRKPKNPTCDNCNHMELRQVRTGNTRYCGLMGLYIPDNEQSPTCDFHTAVSKFERMMTAKARKGGVQ